MRLLSDTFSLQLLPLLPDRQLVDVRRTICLSEGVLNAERFLSEEESLKPFFERKDGVPNGSCS
jgi:hypothetical protein